MTEQEQKDIIDGLTRCSDLAGATCNGCPWEDKTTGECFNRLAAGAIQLIRELLQPKTAHWVWDPNGMDWNISAWKCSECHVRNDNLPGNIQNEKHILRFSGSKFCPNCGKRMVRST